MEDMIVDGVCARDNMLCDLTIRVSTSSTKNHAQHTRPQCTLEIS